MSPSFWALIYLVVGAFLTWAIAQHALSNEDPKIAHIMRTPQSAAGFLFLSTVFWLPAMLVSLFISGRRT